MEPVKVHRVHFFELTAQTIKSISYNERSSRIAVLREDSSIEIWNVKNNPFVEKVVPGSSDNTIEVVCWSQGRLFSAGLSGNIIEYDPLTPVPKKIEPVAGSCVVWCLRPDKKNNFLAAGTEAGYICIYSIESGKLEFEKNLSKQEGRIMCLDWHVSGNIIVAGSFDTIRIWNVETGQISDRIILGRAERKDPTIVWCIAITRDMTIISGDSQGKVSFWDGEMGTLLSSPEPHKADVLSLCLSKDESHLYASGVQPAIYKYVKTTIQSTSSHQNKVVWMKSTQRRIHTHDVRALALTEKYLVSGGVDTQLMLSDPGMKTIKLSPFSHRIYTSVATESSSVLFQFPNKLELWKLGSTTAVAETKREVLPLDSSPAKLVLLKTKEGDWISCSAISSDAHWVAYSTLDEVKLFHVPSRADILNNKVTVSLVNNFPGKIKFVNGLAFTSGKLVLSTLLGKVQVFNYDVENYKLLSSVETNMEIQLLEVSSDSRFFAVASFKGEISIYDLSSGQLYSHLPNYPCEVTVMKFNPNSPFLIVAYSDRKIVEYDINEKSYSDWYRKHIFDSFQKCSPYSVRGITIVPNSDNRFSVYDEKNCFVFRKANALEPAEKRIRKSDDEKRKVGAYFKVINGFKYLLDFAHIQKDEMVAVEITPAEVHSKLPPPLYHKKYGT